MVKGKIKIRARFMLVFDYDGTIQETIKIYAPAIFDIAKRLRTYMMFQSKILAMRAWRAGWGLKMKKCGQTSPPALPTAAKGGRIGAGWRLHAHSGSRWC